MYGVYGVYGQSGPNGRHIPPLFTFIFVVKERKREKKREREQHYVTQMKFQPANQGNEPFNHNLIGYQRVA